MKRDGIFIQIPSIRFVFLLFESNFKYRLVLLLLLRSVEFSMP